MRLVVEKDGQGLAGGEGEKLLLPNRRRTGEEHWHVLHVMSRQEKALARLLGDLSLDFYLPILGEVRYHGRRKVRVEAPLFPGYLFLWGSNDEAYEADRTRKVARLIHVTDQDLLEWELTNLDRAIRSGAPLTSLPSIPKGTKVRVRTGPFKGIEGIVWRRKGAERLILEVQMLGSAASLEVDGALLDPID